MEKYFGTYQRFETVSKKDASVLLGAESIVGEIYDIEIEFDGSVQKAWLVSRFNKRIGYFNADFSRKLSILAAQDMTCKAVLSFVAFTDHPDDGIYWGNVAVICYNPAYTDEFEVFIKQVSERLGDGIRPKIDLNADGVNKIIETDGSWMPKQTCSYPDKEKGTAIVKRRRSITDKLVEQGRAGNKGCYVISWIFLLALVALVVYVIVKLV